MAAAIQYLQALFKLLRDYAALLFHAESQREADYLGQDIAV